MKSNDKLRVVPAPTPIRTPMSDEMRKMAADACFNGATSFALVITRDDGCIIHAHNVGGEGLSKLLGAVAFLRVTLEAKIET